MANDIVQDFRNILLNYAAMHPDIGYIQGMSDLLSPILSTVQEESDAYWCFKGSMQQTLFASAPTNQANAMDLNLVCLNINLLFGYIY